MKRTQERAPRTKKKLNLRVKKNGKVYLLAVLATVAIAVFINTTFPEYVVKNGDVISHSHNLLLNLTIPINYFLFVGLMLSAAILLIVYIVSFKYGDFDGINSSIRSFASVVLISTSVLGIIALLFIFTVNTDGSSESKSSAALTAYAGSQPSSESLELKHKAYANEMDALIGAVSKDENTGKDFLDATLGNKDKGYDSKDTIFKVVEKGNKYYLVGASKGAGNVNDIVEYGEISKTQVKELGKLTIEVTYDNNW